MICIRPALLLAVTATGTAVSMSVLAGWQRGGWLAERLVWVAIGVVLVIGAHLLPALCRSAPVSGRLVAFVLWLGCMAAASYGHTTFFLLSQSHAGEVRVSAVPIVGIPTHRELTDVMADRASVMAKRARADARHCIRDCPTLHARREALAARLDALDAEAADVRRYQGIEDSNAGSLATARDDPVTARLATLYGLPEARLDLFAGLAFAAVLEGVACLLWWIALMPWTPASSVTDRHEAVRGVTTDTSTVVTLARSPTQPTAQPTLQPAVQPAVTLPESAVAKLQRDIESGAVKPTVASIRRHLGCSQAKASALRRQLAEHTA
jgi:hypothetical protein